MKILLTSDLHQRIEKWSALVAAVRREQPRFVLIAGDLLPKADICQDGLRVGSPTVLRFIQEHQPLLGCSGHIHESPHQPGGHWTAQVGRTAWFQPGQVGLRLHYVCVELGAGLEVLGARHSVF